MLHMPFCVVLDLCQHNRMKPVKCTVDVGKVGMLRAIWHAELVLHASSCVIAWLGVINCRMVEKQRRDMGGRLASTAGDIGQNGVSGCSEDKR